MMNFRKITSLFVIFSFFLSSCVSTTGTSKGFSVGPLLSSTYFRTEANDQGLSKPKIDVIIPVFDPGLPEKNNQNANQNIWPELRRAEATRFAYKLKEALEKTEKFGAVRITPDKTATGDLYVLGKINKSNGAEVEIELEVLDISGSHWMSASFHHEVEPSFHSDMRNKNKDPYDPVFDDAAKKITEELVYHAAKDLNNLQSLTEVRFGTNFSDSAFLPYLKSENNITSLKRKPSENDPMLKRVQAIRVRDQLFIDGLQQNYTAFSDQMNDSYLMWQEQSLLEMEAEHDAKMEAAGKAIGGVLLVGLAVLSAVAGAKSDSQAGQTAGTTGAVLGGMAGASMLQDSFKTSEEAKVHRDALEELGQSVDMELAPQVIEFEKETVKLTGDAKEQFAQWRTFLKEIFEQETTPNVQL
jgi:hypothetical protein